MIRTIILTILITAMSIASHAQNSNVLGGNSGEFNGPFPSWLDVKKNFGAKGDGKTDDTRALQAGLDAAATDASHTVLYLPAGNYRISATLHINNRINMSVIGEDPALVTISWFGAQHGTLLWLNGTAYSKFDRMTFNGRGLADVAVEQAWDGKKPHFDTANEYADDVFTDVGFGIRGGAMGNGFAETSILRDRFIRNSQAGVSLGNFNALDIWVRQCLFQDCALGVTNSFGAGNFKVYQCLFRHSLKSDLQMGNTGEFSVRGNTSVGSRAFFVAGFTRNPACITLEGNTVIDPLNTLAISVSNQGPVLFLDNTIRSRPNTDGTVVWFGTDSYCANNTFSTDNALLAGSGSIIRDSRVAGLAELKRLKILALPQSEPRVSRMIFEVPAGSDAARIQSIIYRASKLTGRRPVVHFGYGIYRVNTTLVMPSNSDTQLIGDGFGDQRGTTLAWAGAAGGVLLRLQGPSAVTIKDLALKGSAGSINLLISQPDQPGSKLYLNEFHQVGGQTGLLVNGVDYLEISGVDVAFSHLSTAINVIGGKHAGSGASAQTIIYSGAESDNAISHKVSAGGRLRIQDTWYEGGVQSIYASLAGKSFFIAAGSHIAVLPNTNAISLYNFSGNVLLAADDLTGLANISGLNPDGQLVVLGTLAESEPFLTGTSLSRFNGELLLNRGRTHGLTILNGGSYKLDDLGNLGNWSPPELINVAQIAKGNQAGQTTVRLYRVMSLGGVVGLDVEPR